MNTAARTQRGFSLLELMVSLALSLVVVLALATLYQNTSRNNESMASTGELIESGRAAVALLADDIQHGGFWAGYIPAYEDLSHDVIPGDLPLTVPNPCAAVSGWDSAYYLQILGIPLQPTETLPAGTGCVPGPAQRADTDALVVRHAATCAAGTGTCPAAVTGEMYMQVGRCTRELAGTAGAASTASSLVLASTAATANNAYTGTLVRLIRGPGAGQVRRIVGYSGSTRTASIVPDWDATLGTPTANTTYSLVGHIGTVGFPLTMRDCQTTTPATPAPMHQVVSHLYYIADVTRGTVTVPTLMRSSLGAAGGSLAHQLPEELVPGVEALRVYLGIDDTSDTGAILDDVQQAAAIEWADASEQYSPVNRSDGLPDRFVRCTSATPCTALELRNVVAARIFVLARSRDTTAGYVDTKAYCLADANPDGTCPADAVVAAPNDGIKRHVFSTGIRLHNISGRRETP